MKKNYTIVGSGVIALGLFFACGCKSTVMDKREYRPVDDPGAKAPVQEVQAPAEQTGQTAAPAKKTVEQPVQDPQTPAAFAPMEGSWSNEGLADSGKGKSKATQKKAPRKIRTAPNGVYVVKSGDTMGKIAYAHGVSLRVLLKANSMDLKAASRLRIGQKILIPGKDGKVNAQAAAAAKAAPKTKERKLNTALLNADGTYTVKSGDNIPKIARKLGVKSKDLQNANNLSNEATRRLKIGQKLLVPGKSAAAMPTQTAPADQQDDLSKILKEAENTQNAAPAANTEAAAPAAPAAQPAQAAAETAAPATNVTGDSVFVELPADITIEEFAKVNKTTVETLRKLNAEIPADGKLKAGMILFVPKQ